ncbi:hypothetical protein LXL04_016804 [Taraxacum kok-saghyz]
MSSKIKYAESENRNRLRLSSSSPYRFGSFFFFLNIILEAIFPTTTTSISIDNIRAEQRRLEALKLYYRVLQAMCIAESQIQHPNNLTYLLTNERFHQCMLACSAELVIATHKTVTMLFPAVLERTGITAFDLIKRNSA